MEATLKICGRVLLILILMIIGAWLNAQLVGAGSYVYLVLYIVYFLVGICVGTMINPRFTKGNNKWVYFIPVVVFAVIGAQFFFYPLIPIASLPYGIGNYLMQFSYLSWTLVGIFANLAFR
ncbi:hypothetical protein [Anaerovorax odorimutans]|uniref:hypothetical protein n=1 Tax=Anaerovorax odorimutans TaxID=109327 RepID=UPI0003F63206|nr:hypothetical protein [Anaerovorax odorimutans]